MLTYVEKRLYMLIMAPRIDIPVSPKYIPVGLSSCADDSCVRTPPPPETHRCASFAPILVEQLDWTYALLCPQLIQQRSSACQ
jgi:hypothetical protein